MSNQGFKGVPGVPEGWELVGIRYGWQGEWCIDEHGKPYQLAGDSVRLVAIIRKIEKPKTYRPFANGAEAEPFFDRKLRPRNGSFGLFLITAMQETLVVFAVYTRSYEYMFHNYVFDDGTPFGVEVTSE